MDPVDEDRTLAGLAARIEPPQAREEVLPAADRLDELAAWWGAAGSGRPPERVARLWPEDVAFSPPKEIAEVAGWAVDQADQAIDGGAELVALSLPATADPSGPAVLAAHVLGLDAVDAVGFPFAAGLHDLSWMILVHSVREGLRRIRGPLAEPGTPAPSPEELLERLCDPVLTAGCAVVLRCASRRTPLVLDGVGAAAAGLFAQRLSPAAPDWWVLADAPAANPLHDRLLAQLKQQPLTRLGLRADPRSPRHNAADGTGATIVLSLLDAALARAENRSRAALSEDAT